MGLLIIKPQIMLSAVHMYLEESPQGMITQMTIKFYALPSKK